MRLRFEGYSSFDEVDRIVDEFISNLSHDIQKKCQDTIFIIIVALRELLNNAVEHGTKLDGNKRVFCELNYDGKAVYVKVTDQGQGFDLFNVLDEIMKKSQDRERCRGICMITSLGFYVYTIGSQVVAKLNIQKLQDTR